MAVKSRRNECGQSTLLFAILLPLMSLFLLGILDYMVTNARVMETVGAADLAAHAGAQEITVLRMARSQPTLRATRLPQSISMPSGQAAPSCSRFPQEVIRDGLPVF